MCDPFDKLQVIQMRRLLRPGHGRCSKKHLGSVDISIEMRECYMLNKAMEKTVRGRETERVI